MLLSLLLKDLLQVRYRALLPAGFVAAMPLLLRLERVPPLATGLLLSVSAFAVVHLATSIVFIQAATLEEKTRGDVLLNVLPISRRQVVLSRYLFVAGMASVLAAGHVAVLAAVYRMQAPVDGALLLNCLSLAVAAPVVLWSLVLPFVVRFGMTRANLVANLAALLPMLLIAPLARQIRGRTALDAVRAIGGLSPLVPLAAALALAAVLAAVSYAVSVRVYERRDF